MTFAELQEQCWQSLPPLRKRLVGRDTVNDFVSLAIQNWQGEYLAACQDNDERGVYVHAMLGNVKRMHQAASPYESTEYGFIWIFFLQAVAVAVIQWLVKWWLDRNANRVLIEGWREELTK